MLFAASLSIAEPASAQSRQTEYVEPARPLTVAEALDLAERHNPQLRAAGAAVQGASAAIVTARAYRNPEVNVGGFGGQRATMNSAVPGFLRGFVVSQPLELPSVRQTRIDAAQLGRDSSDFALAETSLAVRGTVKQAFYQVIRRRGEVELALGNVQLLEDLERRVKVQVDVGEAARLELTRAEAELASARIQHQSSELRLRIALSALHASIGAPGNFDPQQELDPPATLPPLDTLRQQLLSRHPAVAQAETQSRRASSLLKMEQALRRPQPTVWADLFQQPDTAQYRMGLSVTLPIWNRREGPIAEAVAAERQARAVADARRIEITAALERAYGQYQVANQQVQMFESGTLRGAEAAVKAAEAAFRFGERGIIEVLDARRVLRGAQLDFLNAQFDRQAALIDLEQLGVLDLRRRP